MGMFDFLFAPAKPPPEDPRWLQHIFELGPLPEDVRRAEARQWGPSRPEALPPEPRPGRAGPSPTSPGYVPREEHRRRMVKLGHETDPQYLFDLPSIWEKIRETVNDPEYKEFVKKYPETKEPAVLPLTEISKAAGGKEHVKVFKFFGLPLEEADKRKDLDYWKDWLTPFLEGLEKKLNELMPDDIEGVLEFGTTDEGFGLLYLQYGD